MAQKKPRRRSLLLRMEGTFDVPAAKRVELALSRAPDELTVRVDLTRVTEFHDFGIAVLAQAMKDRGIDGVSLTGLRTHQVRVLRYFGVELEQLPVATT